MYAKVFSGATVGLWMRRGRARMEGARQTEKVREREPERKKGGVDSTFSKLSQTALGGSAA